MKKYRNIFMFTFATMAIFFVSNFAFANVNNITKIVFTTEPKSLALGEISGGINIQAQNSSGIGEKMDVAGGKMTVSVSDGEISSSAATWENITSPLTVNSNWTGRTVYYKNSSAGVYTISVTLDISGKSWTVAQDITVGGSGGGADGGIGTTTATSTDSTATTTTTTTTTNNNSGGTTVVYSVHYIQEDLSDYEEPTSFEVGAGRARLSYVNSPVSFEAKHKVSKDLSTKSCDYIWNFGDGASLTGEDVDHIYKYAGEYNVILNGACGDLKSVARTAVKVLTPSVSMNTKPDGAVEIFNQGKYEINLYNWKIQSGNAGFVFPQDTIVSANKSVTFAPEYLKLSDLNNGIILVDASNKAVVQSNGNIAGTNPGREISLEEFSKFVLAYQGTIQPTRQITTLTLSTAPSPSSSDEGKGTTTPAVIPMTAAAVDAIINDENKPGFWGKLFHPVRTIKETFYQ